MNGMQRIGDVAARYKVSSRTLRYYEEIGLLWAERREFSPVRYYDGAAIRRLEQILMLRRLDLPITDICAIFASRGMAVAVDALARKVSALDIEIRRMTELRGLIESSLTRLRERGDLETGLRCDAMPAMPREENGTMLHEVSTTLSHVRIIELKPMTVACYCHQSASPENDATAVLHRWAKAQGYIDQASTRWFGFNNPSPTPGQAVYGYEVWVTLPEEVQPPAPIEAKRFGGGLYAVIPAFMDEIPERWQKLVQWLKDNTHQYESAGHQWLEETISPGLKADENAQLDLYMPIRRKG